jgi:hypothetical protein
VEVASWRPGWRLQAGTPGSAWERLGASGGPVDRHTRSGTQGHFTAWQAAHDLLLALVDFWWPNIVNAFLFPHLTGFPCAPLPLGRPITSLTASGRAPRDSSAEDESSAGANTGRLAVCCPLRKEAGASKRAVGKALSWPFSGLRDLAATGAVEPAGQGHADATVASVGMRVHHDDTEPYLSPSIHPLFRPATRGRQFTGWTGTHTHIHIHPHKPTHTRTRTRTHTASPSSRGSVAASNQPATWLTTMFRCTDVGLWVKAATGKMRMTRPPPGRPPPAVTYSQLPYFVLPFPN